MNVVKITMGGLLAFALTGCTPSTEPEVDPAVPAEVSVSGSELTAEVACGSCIYEMEGVKGCKTAVKIGETPYLVKGGGLNAHTSGLCDGPKQAVLTGEVKEGVFAATKIALVEPK